MIKKILLILIITLNLYADNEIIVAVDEWVPFRMLSGKRYSGIDFDLWKKIEKELNITVKFERYPWGRALDKLAKGEVDAMSGLAYTDERAKLYYYSDSPYYTCTTTFYTQKGLGKKINTYDDLYTLKSLGFVIGSAYFDKFDTDNKLNKVEVATELQLLKLLKSKRVEAIIGTSCQVDYQLKTLGFDSSFDKSNYKPNNDVNLYITFSKKSSKLNLFYKINEFLNKMNKEKFNDEIKLKYF